MKSRRSFVPFAMAGSALACLALLSLPLNGVAATLYWDTNGATDGAGGPSPTGTWDAATTPNWTLDSTGTSATTTYTAASDVVFSAGTDATGGYTVTVADAEAANSLLFEDGAVTLAGSGSPSLTIGAGGITITSNSTTTFDATLPITIGAAQNWANNGSGTLFVNSLLTYSNKLTLTSGTMRFQTSTNTGAGGLRINGASVITTQAGFAGTGALQLSSGSLAPGSSSITVANPYSFDGNFTLNPGTSSAHLTLSGTGTISNTPTITLNDTVGAGTTLSGTVTLNSAATFVGAGSITLSGSVALNNAVNFANGGTLAVSGLLTGTGNITKTGGIMTLGTTLAQAYTGTLALNGASLTMTNSATVLNNIFNASSSLALSGGYLRQNNVGAGGHIETFASTTVNQGVSQIQQVRTSGGVPVTNLGTLSRSGVGGTLYLNESSVSGAPGFKSPTTNTNGIIGGWLIFAINQNVNAPTDFAANGATPNTSVFTVPTYTTNTWGGTTNTNVTSSNAVANGSNTNSLRFNTAAATTVTLSGTSQIHSGGILLTNTVAANDQTITGGVLIGGSSGDLIVHNYSGTTIGGLGALVINSQIANGASATALTKAGTGALVLGGSNIFTGGVYINAGEVRLNNANALNSAAPNSVTFTNANATFILSQVLSLNGNSVTISGLNTSAVIGVGTAAPTIQNTPGGSVANAVLTINNSAANTFAGNIQNGTGGGNLGLTKSGTATLSLTGTNLYTGATTVTAGTLLSARSIDTSSAVQVNSGAKLDLTTPGLTRNSTQTLSGAGTVLGAVTINSGGIVTPGDAGAAGTLTLGSLTMSAGSIGNFQFGGGNSLVATTGNLTFTGTTSINLFNGINNFGNAQSGTTFTLFNFGGTETGNVSSLLTWANAPNGLSAAFSLSGTTVVATISGALVGFSTWINTGGGSWADSGNWDAGGVPNSPTATANFASSITAPSVVTLEGDKTVGVITLDNTNSYTINSGTATTSTIILSNSSAAALINVNNGSHAINAPISLTDNLAVSVINSIDTLTLGGPISNTAGAKTLTKNGPGTVVLSGSNSYGGAAGTIGTNFNAGKIRVGDNSAFGAGDVAINGSVTLQAGAPSLTLANNMVIGNGFTATVDTLGNTLTLSGIVSNTSANGTLAVASTSGTGTVILLGSNSYGGGTSIGTNTTLQVGNNTSTGALPATGTITNAGALVFKRSDTSTVVVGNNIIGAGTLTQNGGAGNVVQLNGANSFSGGTTVTSGTIRLGANNAIGTGDLVVSGAGGLDLNGKNATVGGFSGAGVLDSGSAGTMTFSIGNNQNGGTFSGTIKNSVGTLGITKNGSGTETLNGINNYSGTTTLNSGTLNLLGSGTLSGALTVNTGTMVVGGSNTLTGTVDVTGVGGNASLTVRDNAIINSAAALKISSNNPVPGTGNPGASTLLLRDNANVTVASFSMGNGSRVPIGTSVTIQDNASFTVNGNFTLVSTIGGTASNDTLNLNGGTLTVAAFDVFQGSSPGSQTTTINFNGGVLRPTATNANFLPALPNFTARVLGGGAKIDTNNFDITVAAALISGTANDGGLIKSGSGTLTLSGTTANTYTGLTTGSAGTLALGKSDGVNAIGGNTSVDGGTIKWLANEQVVNTGTMTLTSGSVDLNGKTETLGSFTNTGGTFTTGSGGHLIGTSATVTFAGGTNTVSPGSSVEDGHVVITGGDNTVQTSGTLRVTSPGTGLEITGATLKLDSDATAPGILLLENNVTTFASSGTAAILNNGGGGLPGLVDLAGGTRSFTVANGGATIDLLVSASITNGGLTKAGAGTMQLTGNNTFTGPTTISASGGTLEAAANGALGQGAVGTASITVNNGGTLLLSNAGASDRVKDTAGIFLAGGTIQKGSGVNEGTTTADGMGMLTLTANSSLDFTLTAGTMTFDDFTPNGFVLAINNYVGTGSPGGTDQLIFSSDLQTNLGNLNNFDFGFGPGVNVAQQQVQPGFFEIYSVTPVPEPSTVLGALALLGFVGYRERKRIGKLAELLRRKQTA